MNDITHLKDQCRLSHGCRSPIYQCEVCPHRAPAKTNVVQLSNCRNSGNGAREALMALFEERGVDILLAELWTRGFKIVPLELKDLENNQ